MQLTELRTKALALQPDERETLAHDLLDSLSIESTGAIDEAWLTEIDRRMEDVAEGRVDMVPYDQFREEIRKKTGW
ncbi:MAG: addiction module protein [Acidobacteriota bacterium]|nr:addiction module protein [Acidobacteriota bacterium]